MEHRLYQMKLTVTIVLDKLTKQVGKTVLWLDTVRQKPKNQNNIPKYCIIVAKFVIAVPVSN